MARNDEFNDIPDLGPARDDLDGKPLPTAGKPAKPKKAAPPPPPREPSGGSRSGGGNGLVYFVLLVLILALGGFGYWSYQQQGLLERKLQAAQATLSQSQDRLSHLESLISATDESASKSGAALQARINQQAESEKKRTKHVDSEIAKLWTIAYQRNKPQIEALDKTVAGLSEGTASLKQEVETLSGAMSQTRETLAAASQRLDANQADLRSLGGSHQGLSSELNDLASRVRRQDAANQEFDKLQEQQLQALTRRVEQLAAKPSVSSDLRQQLEEQQKAIESINGYRRQVNQELLRLRERVNQLQLDVQQQP
ncbi:hypothetical protein [Motiliproteus sp. SC1-56]|uniref:hypothetical protein n=1 Tax=Motiliproteus sp. SC1-56 TaxID=2799565 RepID=UPI001A90B9FB|nr:hypothetical protein [Motiliproteus sp. SC1-56]